MRRPAPLLARGSAALVMVLAGACTRVIDLEVEEGPKRLVVEGRLELHEASDEQAIFLSTTERLSETDGPPPARGATVSVTDEAGQAVHFVPLPSNPGVYTARMKPVVGAQYTLKIDYEGEHYEAVARVIPGPPIDSLYFKLEPEGLSGPAGLRAVIDYSDPPGSRNYYLWELNVNGEPRTSTDGGARFRIISEDRFYDGGQVIGYQPYDEEEVEPGEVVEMRQIALSEEAYRYHVTLFEQTTEQDGPFSTPPASVRGNVTNLTNPAHAPLGFFFAAQVSVRRMVVPPVSTP